MGKNHTGRYLAKHNQLLHEISIRKAFKKLQKPEPVRPARPASERIPINSAAIFAKLKFLH
jgi:hypothetical protein